MDRRHLVRLRLQAAGIESPVLTLPAAMRTAAEAAKVLGCVVGAIGNSLLFMADGEPLLVMTSGRHRASTNLIASAVGAHRVEMARPKQVREFTGQVIGGVAPTGHPAPIQTLVDEALQQYEQIWVAAGTPHTVVRLSFAQLISLTQGKLIVVANAERPEPQDL